MSENNTNASRPKTKVVKQFFHHPANGRFVGGETEDPEEEKSTSTLSTLLLTGLMYTFAIGGAYGIEESVMGGGPLLTLISIVLIPFLIALPTALVVAELASTISSNGGFLMWVKLSVHRVVYLTLVILSVFLIFTDNALYPVLFSEYVCSVAPCPTGARVGLRLLMLAATFILNLLGIEIVGISSVIITAVTVFPFVAMFVIHLFSTGFYINWASLATIPSNVQWSAFIATASWNLSGLEQAGAVAEDVRQPQHSILRALLALLGLALVTYIPPVLTGVSTTDGPLRLEEWETGFWTQVAHGVGGNGLQMIMTLSSVVSAFGLTLSALCTTSHIIAGMALTEAIPNPLRDYLARRHPRFQTHHYTITLNVALTAVFSTCLDFGPLVMLDQVLYGIRVVFIFLAFFRMRKLYPHLKRPFKVPGGFALSVYFGVTVVLNLLLIMLFLFHDVFTFVFCLILLCASAGVSYWYCNYIRHEDFLGEIVTTIEEVDA